MSNNNNKKENDFIRFLRFVTALILVGTMLALLFGCADMCYIETRPYPTHTYYHYYYPYNGHVLITNPRPRHVTPPPPPPPPRKPNTPPRKSGRR